MPTTKHLIISAGVSATTVLIATPVSAREHCPDPPTQTEAIVSVETGIFSALKNEDKVSWERLTVRDFVAFEGGHRYGRTDFFELLRSAHAAGRYFEWNVTGPRIAVSCTLATLVYVNQGSVSQGSSRSAVSWLETATFRYAGGQWRAVFIESMRDADSAAIHQRPPAATLSWARTMTRQHGIDGYFAGTGIRLDASAEAVDRFGQLDIVFHF